jgi:hypothetical protein
VEPEQTVETSGENGDLGMFTEAEMRNQIDPRNHQERDLFPLHHYLLPYCQVQAQV